LICYFSSYRYLLYTKYNNGCCLSSISRLFFKFNY